MRSLLHYPKNLILPLCLALFFTTGLGSRAAAQSPEFDLPTPVTGSVIEGRIAPLDIGDARQTRHFYTFGGARGDFVLEVESLNLEGDVDLFTAGNLRPLTKVTLYGGGSGALRVARTVFLRAEEKLILRVQARTPNDAEGTYRVRFAGTFVAASAPPPEAPEAVAPPATAARAIDKSVRRVTSTGARIEEPPSPAPVEPAERARGETEERTEAAPPAAKRRNQPKKAPPARTQTARRNTAKSRTAKSETPAAAEVSANDPNPAAKNEGAPASEMAPATAEEKPAPARSGGRRNTRANRGAPKATRREETRKVEPAPTTQPAPEPAAGARLIILLRDGSRIEHEMSGVRRVTVEKGALVIVLRNGKTERQLMSGVLRMSIEP